MFTVLKVLVSSSVQCMFAFVGMVSIRSFISLTFEELYFEEECYMMYSDFMLHIKICFDARRFWILYRIFIKFLSLLVRGYILNFSFWLEFYAASKFPVCYAYDVPAPKRS